jgi:hypothetical protein
MTLRAVSKNISYEVFFCFTHPKMLNDIIKAKERNNEKYAKAPRDPDQYTRTRCAGKHCVFD